MSENNVKPQTIYRVCKNKDNPYVQIDKTPLYDNRLSLKSKGLLCIMLSMPDNWEFHRSHLLSFCTDGKDALKAAMKELEECGYASISNERDEQGRIVRWVTSVFETPKHNNLSTGSGKSATPRSGKSASGEKPHNPCSTGHLEDLPRSVKSASGPNPPNPYTPTFPENSSRSGKSAPTNNKTNNKNNNVVVSKKEGSKPHNLSPTTAIGLNQLAISVGIPMFIVNQHIEKHGIPSVMEKLTMLCSTKDIANPIGWFQASLNKNYMQPEAGRNQEPRRVVPDYEETQNYLASQNTKRSSHLAARGGMKSLRDALKGSSYGAL
jgi:hypothetical protein